MDNEKIVTLQLQLTRRKAWLLLTAFFICWHPGFLGSETLTLTTYYPAPYGGYVSLLTTGKTILARDGGNVGIGTATPGVRLEVAQNGAIKVGSAYLSSGGDYTHLANNEWYNGGAWTTNGSAGVLYQQSGQNNAWYTHDSGGNHTSRMNLDGSGNLTVTNNLSVAGTITGVCTPRAYWLNGGGACSGTERVMGWYGNGVAVSGMLFTGGSLQSGGNWTYISVGADRSGTLWCCKVN